jgi:hypothetical protein
MWRSTSCSHPHPPLNVVASRLLLVPSILLFVPTSKLIIIVFHVNHCTITATPLNSVNWAKEQLRTLVEITDLRQRNNLTLSLSQHSYLDAVSTSKDLKPVSNTTGPSAKLHSGQSPSTSTEYHAMCRIPYRKTIDSRMYISLGTCPDISYTVTTIPRFVWKPWNASLGRCSPHPLLHTHRLLSWLIPGWFATATATASCIRTNPRHPHDQLPPEPLPPNADILHALDLKAIWRELARRFVLSSSSLLP